MGFIKHTSLLVFFALGVVAYASIPLPHPSQLPLVTAVPIPDFHYLNDYVTSTPEPCIETPTLEPMTGTPTPMTVSPNPTSSSSPTASPTPTISSSPTVSPVPSIPHPGCKNGCASHSKGPNMCFEKKQTCCYKHSICATKTKKVQFCKADKAEKCVEKCTKECLKIPRTTMKKKCKKQTVYEARKWCKIQWFGMCKPVAVEKEVCCNHPETVYDQVCKDICNPDCKTVTVYQIITKTFKYETYCAKLSCGRFKDVGNAVKPAPYTSKTLVHKTNGKVVDHKPAGIVQIN